MKQIGASIVEASSGCVAQSGIKESIDQLNQEWARLDHQVIIVIGYSVLYAHPHIKVILATSL